MFGRCREPRQESGQFTEREGLRFRHALSCTKFLRKTQQPQRRFCDFRAARCLRRRGARVLRWLCRQRRISTRRPDRSELIHYDGVEPELVSERCSRGLNYALTLGFNRLQRARRRSERCNLRRTGGRNPRKPTASPFHCSLPSRYEKCRRSKPIDNAIVL